MASSSSSDSLTFSPATSASDDVTYGNDQSNFATNYVLDTSASLVGLGHNNLEPIQSYGSGSNNALMIGSAEGPAYGSGLDNVLFIGQGEGSTNDIFFGSVDGSFNGLGPNNGLFIGSTQGSTFGLPSNNGLFIGSADGPANGSGSNNGFFIGSAHGMANGSGLNNGFSIGSAQGSANPSVPLANPAPLSEVGPDNSVPQPAERPRARGRPFGSKNRPKAEVINVDQGFVPKTLVLEVPSGVDIVQMIRDFTAAHGVGVKIHSGLGWVQNVTIQNFQANEPNTSRNGVQELVTLSGLFVGPAQRNPPINHGARITGLPHNYIKVLLNGPNVGLWGGQVVDRLIAAGPVIINVTTFKSYDYHRLVPNPTNIASSSGAGSSRGGPNPNSGSSSGNGPYMGGGPSRGPSYMGQKRNRYSNY